MNVGRHFLSILDLTPAELREIIDLASRIKRERTLGPAAPTARALAGRHVGLLFEKPSLRTRVTFTIGVRELGGDIVEIPADVMHADREPINDRSEEHTSELQSQSNLVCRLLLEKKKKKNKLLTSSEKHDH